jgi:Bifunctional DNA primase/polymerase, N-terminal
MASLSDEQKQQIRFWIYTIGCDLAACYSQEKNKYKERWGDNIINDIDYDKRLEQGWYNDGVAVICGQLRRGPYKGKWITCLDFDSKDTFDKFCNILGISLEQLAKWTRVEWHGSVERIHVFLITSKPFKNLAAAGVEIKANKLLAFVSPSLHKSGQAYRAFDRESVAILDDIDQLRIEGILEIFVKTCTNDDRTYFDEDGRNKYIEYLNTEGTILRAGERHPGTVANANSMFFKYLGEWKDMSDDDRFNRLVSWHNKVCDPPLFQERGRENEVREIWDSIKQKFTGKRQEERDKREDEEHNSTYAYSGPDLPELKGNVFYQINAKPTKFIIAHKQNKQLIETTLKTTAEENSKTDQKIITQHLVHNRTFLTCIPVKIIRHKNPLSYLDISVKYTITFVDAAGEYNTLSHKTLSEILGCLRDLGYVLSDGAEGALGTMIQAYKENKIIEDNQETEFTGFFIVPDAETNTNIIIASGVDNKKEISTSELKDALKCINDAVKYYEGRLDLLSTTITWGMIAPAIYMLKSNDYFLKWLHFYGFTNATKSNSGRFALALDGHHDDEKFNKHLTDIDTIARLGEVIGKTTFPKLIDECDLNDKERRWLINALKTAINGRIARSKFISNSSRTSTGIPALSPCILTSNPSPPFHDSAYMRRVIDRGFQQSESFKENDPKAIEFVGWLLTYLSKLKALGDFRNWYVMNHQDVFLDDKRPSPLDLGKKILEAAYECAGMKMPEWFNQRLTESQLEDSLSDNTGIIKRGFETYINVNLKNFFGIDVFTDTAIITAISNRLFKLVDRNLLPDIKRDKDCNIRIRKGILSELYRYNITSDQLPNLKALADYMGVSQPVKKNAGHMVIICTAEQLTNYFDSTEEEIEKTT